MENEEKMVKMENKEKIRTHKANKKFTYKKGSDDKLVIIEETKEVKELKPNKNSQTNNDNNKNNLRKFFISSLSQI